MSVSLLAADARRLTDQIKVSVEGVWVLITQAYTDRVWAALGYGSWDEYCTREFGTSRLRLPREERAEVVASLRESGLSLRAIAAATGESKDTVARSLTDAVSNETPAIVPIRPIPTAMPPDLVAEVEDFYDRLDVGEDVLDDHVSPDALEARLPPRPPVTGMDGKQYTASRASASAPRRPPLTDAAQRAAWEFRKSIERIERIAADDRFPANKEQVAAALRGHLIYATEVCQDLLGRLDHQSQEDR
jgi:hypothetical protein